MKKKLDGMIACIDRSPLWVMGFLLAIFNFIPFFRLGQGCVFPYHDQLDETLLTYVLSGRHFLTGAEKFPEILGGINPSGMQPAAALFVPLYRYLDPLVAFLAQYILLFLAAFYGMYFCVKEMTGSSILALVAGGCFCMLPWQPVYGMSVVGVPLALWCFLCLYRKKHLITSLFMLLIMGLTSHLVLIGYAILGIWFLALVWMWIKKERNRLPAYGFLLLTGVYVAVNHRLFAEVLLGRRDYVSHREEMVNYASPLWETVQNVFLHSAQHAESLHQGLIISILVMLAVAGVCLGGKEKEWKRRYVAAVTGFLLLCGIALLYGLCKWEPVVQFKNSCTGFIHYFQLERFYWLYPAGWYLEFMLCFSLWWWIPVAGNGTGTESKEESRAKCRDGEPVQAGHGIRAKEVWQGICKSPVTRLLVLVILLLPTLQEIKVNSYLYMNVNQINNGSGITGYISWESFYAEDLMQQLEDAIGRDMEGYRVAHLGISPAPALMHGFYTVDGYSNNYPLEYKHRFRQVIARELDKNEYTRLYFDQWGSRCYLFNAATGNAWILGKNTQVVYERLDFDMEALRQLGCDYIFSCGIIQNAEELGLSLLGYFETESSYWGVWLYETGTGL